MSDWELIQSFVGERSESAFAELVERHLNLVYSTAMRLARDPHLAEDVTQQVFALLARKADRLGKGTIVSAWLYRAARNIASETLRRDLRWRRREEIAMAQINESSDAAWHELEPLLDEAMGGLSPTDHDALVLRYFENKSLREVAEAMGASEDAAQKRVSRAVDRLRELLAQRGGTTTATAVVASMSAHAVQLAPGTIAIRAAKMSSSAASRIPSAKVFVGTAVIGMLSVGLWSLYRVNVRLQEELAEARSTAVSARISAAAQSELELQRRLRTEHFELLSLRGQVATLRKELREKQSGNQEVAVAQGKEDSIFFTAELTNRVQHGQTLVIGGWERDGLRGYLVITPSIDATNAEKTLVIKTKAIRAPEEFWGQIGWAAYKSDLRRSALAGVLAPEHIEQLVALLKATNGAEISNESTTPVSDGGKTSFGWSVSDDDDAQETLMMTDMYPRIGSDGKTVEIELRPTPAPPDIELRRAGAQASREVE